MLVAPLVALGLAGPRLRPPSVPLVTHDPYFSVWSPGDHLYDVDTVHWSGKPQPMVALIRIDGEAFRLMGKEPSAIPPLPQAELTITPTRSIYRFANAKATVFLQFCSPLLPHDLDLMARPATYATFYARSSDGKPHDVDVYFEIPGMLAVDHGSQMVEARPASIKGMTAGQVGSVAQEVLGRSGDDLRIDWGHAYLAGGTQEGWTSEYGDGPAMRSRFAATGSLEGLAAARPKGPISAEKVSLAMAGRLSVRESKMPSATAIVAYDDEYSMQYFDRPLRPYWRRNGMDGAAMIAAASSQRNRVLDACLGFDDKLTADLVDVGGGKYADIAILAYRQAIAACKICADSNGRPLLFPKENFSNGCVNTVDVIYPMSPLFFLLGPDLAKSMLVPILDYGSSKRWKFPFAPHDLGTYPLATGQVYGGGEVDETNQMPVEESGNMILLVAALAKAEGNADFAAKYWPALTRWAKFLKAKGLDPENQLCTDDFMGHLAHNANLSIKAILALGAFGKLCEMRGDHASAKEFGNLAKSYAGKWLEMANDGGHSRLAFDKAGTWSQKYNMVWDGLLDLNLFPSEFKQREMAFYRQSMNRYGLPLDSRSPGTKVDWLHWTATLTGNRADFEALIAPMWDFLNETVDRVPICDWVRTDGPRHIGMIARPVLGGVYLPMLGQPGLWQAWFGKGQKQSKPWAKLPLAVRTTVLPCAIDAPQPWKYSTSRPESGWELPGFADSGWSTGRSGFGTAETPGARIGTTWAGSDIWLRRTFDLSGPDRSTLRLLVHHDEDVEIYINGRLAAKLTGYTTNYRQARIEAEALAALDLSGRNTIAVHCRQTTGGQYIDVGIVSVKGP